MRSVFQYNEGDDEPGQTAGSTEKTIGVSKAQDIGRAYLTVSNVS